MVASEFLITLTVSCFLIPSMDGQRYLRADGVTDTYTLINRKLGGTAVEVPDCNHKVKHIHQGYDVQLDRQVFYFHAHVAHDNDRCIKFDRQRTEIKVYGSSPDFLKGFSGDTVSLSWNFRLDAHFQPSNSFTHLHQLKIVGGDDRLPLITLSPWKKSPEDELQVLHIGPNGTLTVLASAPLAPFKGNWVHVHEEATYGIRGRYTVIITDVDTDFVLLTLTVDGLSMWRPEAEFVRPKWGIYRSLNDKDQLRDEIVRFDTFCLAKGSPRCPIPLQKSVFLFWGVPVSFAHAKLCIYVIMLCSILYYFRRFLVNPIVTLIRLNR